MVIESSPEESSQDSQTVKRFASTPEDRLKQSSAYLEGLLAQFRANKTLSAPPPQQPPLSSSSPTPAACVAAPPEEQPVIEPSNARSAPIQEKGESSGPTPADPSLHTAKADPLIDSPSMPSSLEVPAPPISERQAQTMTSNHPWASAVSSAAANVENQIRWTFGMSSRSASNSSEASRGGGMTSSKEVSQSLGTEDAEAEKQAIAEEEPREKAVEPQGAEDDRREAEVDLSKEAQIETKEVAEQVRASPENRAVVDVASAIETDLADQQADLAAEPVNQEMTAVSEDGDGSTKATNSSRASAFEIANAAPAILSAPVRPLQEQLEAAWGPFELSQLSQGDDDEEESPTWSSNVNASQQRPSAEQPAEAETSQAGGRAEAETSQAGGVASPCPAAATSALSQEDVPTSQEPSASAALVSSSQETGSQQQESSIGPPTFHADMSLPFSFAASDAGSAVPHEEARSEAEDETAGPVQRINAVAGPSRRVRFVDPISSSQDCTRRRSPSSSPHRRTVQELSRLEPPSTQEAAQSTFVIDLTSPRPMSFTPHRRPPAQRASAQDEYSQDAEEDTARRLRQRSVMGGSRRKSAERADQLIKHRAKLLQYFRRKVAESQRADLESQHAEDESWREDDDDGAEAEEEEEEGDSVKRGTASAPAASGRLAQQRKHAQALPSKHAQPRLAQSKLNFTTRPSDDDRGQGSSTGAALAPSASGGRIAAVARTNKDDDDDDDDGPIRAGRRRPFTPLILPESGSSSEGVRNGVNHDDGNHASSPSAGGCQVRSPMRGFAAGGPEQVERGECASDQENIPGPSLGDDQQANLDAPSATRSEIDSSASNHSHLSVAVAPIGESQLIESGTSQPQSASMEASQIPRSQPSQSSSADAGGIAGASMAAVNGSLSNMHQQSCSTGSDTEEEEMISRPARLPAPPRPAAASSSAAGPSAPAHPSSGSRAAAATAPPLHVPPPPAIVLEQGLSTSPTLRQLREERELARQETEWLRQQAADAKQRGDSSRRGPVEEEQGHRDDEDGETTAERAADAAADRSAPMLRPLGDLMGGLLRYQRQEEAEPPRAPPAEHSRRAGQAGDDAQEEAATSMARANAAEMAKTTNITRTPTPGQQRPRKRPRTSGSATPAEREAQRRRYNELLASIVD
ncbi:hypothetical protein BDZ90DRAFT_233443 [Jaminaea rosea]|uniref:Uncharacterized protein n=1 Tax=Jaminaea rosea TaxID=1569628 RepID=A0A316UM69_9BASI|nr:hypothetical protein BDZ90DRAFT_233443 [Jaminaea rosea]PWN26310.1 hypothetical protein BDZ90DRAFT_233443 [Jaminaea rosea]